MMSGHDTTPVEGTAALPVAEQMAAIDRRLERIESMVTTLVEQRMIKEWYTPAEVARMLGRAELTVREWCRLGRVNASKRECGRGNSQEWIISHAELERIRNEGLLPQETVSTRL
jgi:hypothetical protein